MTAIARDRGIVAASIVVIAALAWLYLFGLSQDMAGMEGMPGMAREMAPTPFALTAIMWAVMMVGMMLPSALPMILLFTTVQRRQGRQPVLKTAVFIGAYVLVWSVFAVIAAALQSQLGQMELLSPSLAFVSRWLAGAAFLLAAAYEVSPLKNRCLTQCSSPLGFITVHWRPGVAGAFRMGVLHGTYCVGCCWALMLLLFVAGVMNLVWVAVLAILVLVQKVLPWPPRVVALATGAAMLAVGVGLIVS